MRDAVDFVGYQVDATAGYEQGQRWLVIEARGGLVEPATGGCESA